jgi:YjbE family integral membrane protein
MTFDSEFLLRALTIVAIDLTVAGDNALVIALAVRSLPARQQLLGRIWGTVGAVVLRLAFIFVVTYLLRIPLLQLVGGLVLIWIAVKLVRQPAHTDAHTRPAGSLREAIWIIVVADAAMSLDNVLAVAAAAHGDFWLAVFGVALSLPIVVWGSGLVAWLMNRYTWIIWVGGGILGWVAGEMIVDDQMVEPWLHRVRLVIPAVLTIAITALGWFTQKRQDVRPAPRLVR